MDYFTIELQFTADSLCGSVSVDFILSERRECGGLSPVGHWKLLQFRINKIYYNVIDKGFYFWFWKSLFDKQLFQNPTKRAQTN